MFLCATVYFRRDVLILLVRRDFRRVRRATHALNGRHSLLAYLRSQGFNDQRRPPHGVAWAVFLVLVFLSFSGRTGHLLCRSSGPSRGGYVASVRDHVRDNRFRKCYCQKVKGTRCVHSRPEGNVNRQVRRGRRPSRARCVGNGVYRDHPSNLHVANRDHRINHGHYSCVFARCRYRARLMISPTINARGRHGNRHYD